MLRPVYLRIFAVIAIFALIAGCSSDSSTSTTIKQGDLNDPAFQAVQAEGNEMIDSLIARGFAPLSNPWAFPIDTTLNWKDKLPTLPDDTVSYGYDDEGWHSIYIGSFATSNNRVVVDSVRFMNSAALDRGFSNSLRSSTTKSTQPSLSSSPQATPTGLNPCPK